MQLQMEPTWQERQAQVEQQLQQWSSEEFSFREPHVIFDPYGIAPLTALVFFQTASATSVQVTVRDKTGNNDLQYCCPQETRHSVPIYGLYAGWNNQVELRLDDGQCCLVQIQTAVLPQQLAATGAKGTLPVGEWLFTVPVSGSARPAAYDATGQCRWYLTEELAFQITLAHNGRLLTCGPVLLDPPYSAAAIYEMDLLGKIYREYRVPGGVCNGFYEMQNGNLLALHQFFNRGTAADLCIEIKRETGEIIKEWDLRTMLPMTKGGSISQNGSDWFHAASVCYDTETNSVLIAGAHQDIVVSIDYDSGKLNWLLGDPAGWPEELVQQYFLRPEQEPFFWSYAVNSVQVLPDGELICFDNGHLRAKKGGTPLPAEQRYSRVVCYQIDAKRKTVRQSWAYGQQAGNQLYAPYLSNCMQDAAGRLLMNFGGIGFLQGQVAEPPAFFLQKDFPEVEMQTVILVREKETVIYELRLPINCYDAKIIAVAQCSASDPAVAGKVLGQWHGNDVYDLELEWEDAGNLAESYQIQAKLTKEQLLLSGCFQQGEMVLLLLEGNTTLQFYMQTTRAPYLTAGRQTFAKGSERPITYVVSLQGLSGHYEICIGIDDKKYHTGLWFQCA